VKAWLAEAEAGDKAEDAQHGQQRWGDETQWMASEQRRLERIREAKAQLEAEAAGDPADLDLDGPGPSSGMQERGARKDSPSDGSRLWGAVSPAPRSEHQAPVAWRAWWPSTAR